MFLLIFALLTQSASAVTIDRLEASVNSSLILLTDVLKFRHTMPLRSQLDPLFAGTSVATAGPSATDSDIVHFLIDERLIAQQFPVTDPEVEQEINSIQSNNRIDRGSLKNALKEQGFTYDDYFELIRTSTAKRNLIDRDIRTKVSISDDDVKNYFYNHFAKSSTTPLAYRVRIITITPSNYKSVSAAKDVADRALREIKAGEPFEDVAKRVSDDGSAPSGGDLGTLTSDQMSPQIRDQLKKLRIGQVSDVLGSSASRYFILKLVDVNSGDNERLEKMKEEIRNQLATSEYQHQISLWLERQRQVAFVHTAGAPSVAEIPSAR